MRLDIYRRPESNGKFSFLVLPEHQQMPGEVINTDWQLVAANTYTDDSIDQLPDYRISGLQEQIREKGYAISSLSNS